MALGIDDISIGVSINGVADWVQDLKINSIDKATEAIRSTNDLFNTLQAGWQGAAEANFQSNVTKAGEAVCQQLDVIKAGIESLISELVEDWAMQDEQLVEQADDIVSFGNQ